MHLAEPALTLGVEEEYLLVDKSSRDLVNDPPRALMDECAELLGEHVSPELMRAQIEVGTPVCRSVSEVDHNHARTRSESVPKNVENLAHRIHGFGVRRRHDRLSHQWYEFLKRSGCVIKGMEV